MSRIKRPLLVLHLESYRVTVYILRQSIEPWSISITSLSKTIDQSNDAINFIEVYELPQPRLRAWKQFEEYTKRTEEMESSSDFRYLLRLKFWWVYQHSQSIRIGLLYSVLKLCNRTKDIAVNDKSQKAPWFKTERNGLK